MSDLATVATVAGAVGLVTGAAIVRWRMVEQVSEKASAHLRFYTMRWYSAKNSTFRLWREHRRLYPRSKARLFLVGLSIGALLAVVALLV